MEVALRAVTLLLLASACGAADPDLDWLLPGGEDDWLAQLPAPADAERAWAGCTRDIVLETRESERRPWTETGARRSSWDDLQRPLLEETWLTRRGNRPPDTFTEHTWGDHGLIERRSGWRSGEGHLRGDAQRFDERGRLVWTARYTGSGDAQEEEESCTLAWDEADRRVEEDCESGATRLLARTVWTERPLAEGGTEVEAVTTSRLEVPGEPPTVERSRLVDHLDAQGRLVVAEEWEPEDVLVRQEQWTWGPAGRERFQLRDGDGFLRQEERWTYDAHGHLRSHERTSRAAPEQPPTTTTTTWIMDEQGRPRQRDAISELPDGSTQQERVHWVRHARHDLPPTALLDFWRDVEPDLTRDEIHHLTDQGLPLLLADRTGLGSAPPEGRALWTFRDPWGRELGLVELRVRPRGHRVLATSRERLTATCR